MHMIRWLKSMGRKKQHDAKAGNERYNTIFRGQSVMVGLSNFYDFNGFLTLFYVEW